MRISPGCLWSLFLSHHRQMRQENATTGKFANHRNCIGTKNLQTPKQMQEKNVCPTREVLQATRGSQQMSKVRRGEQKGTLALPWFQTWMRGVRCPQVTAELLMMLERVLITWGTPDPVAISSSGLPEPGSQVLEPRDEAGQSLWVLRKCLLGPSAASHIHPPKHSTGRHNVQLPAWAVRTPPTCPPSEPLQTPFRAPGGQRLCPKGRQLAVFTPAASRALRLD